MQCRHVLRSKEDEIKRLKEELNGFEMFKSNTKRQAEVMSRLEKKNKLLAKEAEEKDNKMATLKLETRQYEFQLKQEIAKLKQQCSANPAPEEVEELRKLRGHHREQSKMILKLREKVQLLEV